MDTSALKKFAQEARRQLITQVTARMDQVLSMDSAEIREKEKAVNKLNEEIHSTSKEAVIDRVAYIWFNRFCALRFMDVNRYTNIGTVSPVEGYSQPEILQEAKQGHIDEDLDRFVDKQKVYGLLTGKIPSSDPQQEAFRLLLVGICNSYHALMPFMFEKIADYTELLMPEDLLSQNSILQTVRDALTEDNCKDVEVIGWLYQFYISEKKDEVINRRSIVAKEEIPAATQLFTPHWIVQYLVENTLGRLWMLNRPSSRLVDQMKFYIKPEQDEPDFLIISSPEELKVCDPACGSGHILVYAFKLLYSIYEEEGYDASDIPRFILENNLYGIEIDERAGELAAFSLFMKAREKYKRFFRKSIQPNICVLENVEFTDDELEQYMDKIGRNLFTAPLSKTLNQFNEADNFGSLIRPELTDIDHIRKVIEKKDMSGQLFFYKTHEKVLRVLQQVECLKSKYHVVVANPPYMGAKGMNGRLKVYLQDNFVDAKSDLFAAFVLRIVELSAPMGFCANVVPLVWMFIQSYEQFRRKLWSEISIGSLVRLEYNAFEPACVPVCLFAFQVTQANERKGVFIDLNEFKGYENQSPRLREAISSSDCVWRYTRKLIDLGNIPRGALAFWLPERLIKSMAEMDSLGLTATARKGMYTGENARFVRNWHEIGRYKLVLTSSEQGKWFPYANGGGYRKWYGFLEDVVNWENDGYELKNFKDETGRNRAGAFNLDYLEREGACWTAISNYDFCARYLPTQCLFSSAANAIFSDKYDNDELLGLLNCKVAVAFLKAINPTLNYNAGDIVELVTPNLNESLKTKLKKVSKSVTGIAKRDWDVCEISWNFTSLPLLNSDYSQHTLKATYNQLRTQWQEMTLEMQRLEEENNRIFIDAYGLQDELTPDVHVEEITLTCNPHYRYSGDKTEQELEALLLADTMKEYISYSVGCMFGRYSLDKLGLILANQGETILDYKKHVPNPTFDPDEDNVIPILDGDWFIDDIADRFRSFFRVTFGEENYNENLTFIERAIGKDIRKYFLKDFYNHHVKMYKKRPIYWMFTSPKGSFNALIYMHRYSPDTVSIVLNNYLREFRSKITAKKENLEEISRSPSSSQSDKTKALKEIEKLKRVINELEEYERDVLYPLATKQVEIDLDDGVKANYNKFGKALREVTGLTT